MGLLVAIIKIEFLLLLIIKGVFPYLNKTLL
jgi:hypothetical protein